MRSKQSPLVTFCLVALATSSCTKPETPPDLMTSMHDQAGHVESVGASGYSGIMERLAAVSQDVYSGTDVAVADSFINRGSPSKGLKIVLKGNALALLSGPKDAFLESSKYEQGKQLPVDKATLTFAPSGRDALVATVPNFKFEKEIRLMMQLTGEHNGQGDLQIYAYPLDKNGKTAVVFTKHYRVLDENEMNAPQAEDPTAE